MMKWLGTLLYHNYDILPPGSEPNAFLEAHRLLEAESKPETSLQEHSDSNCVDDVRNIFIHLSTTTYKHA